LNIRYCRIENPFGLSSNKKEGEGEERTALGGNIKREPGRKECCQEAMKLKKIMKRIIFLSGLA